MADKLTIFGLIAITGGVAWIYPPAGVIVAGIACVGIGLGLQLIGNRKTRPTEPPAED